MVKEPSKEIAGERVQKVRHLCLRSRDTRLRRATIWITSKSPGQKAIGQFLGKIAVPRRLLGGPTRTCTSPATLPIDLLYSFIPHPFLALFSFQ